MHEGKDEKMTIKIHNKNMHDNRAGATGGAAGQPPPPVASWAPFLQNLQKRKFLDKK